MHLGGRVGKVFLSLLKQAPSKSQFNSLVRITKLGHG